MKILASITLAVALFVPACRSAPPPEQPLELRLYDVPKGTAASLVTTMKDVLWMGDKNQSVGRAVATPDGRLAVLATPSVHAGVQALVEDVSKHPQTPADQSIELHYYIVWGKPAPSPQPIPPEAGEVKSALDEIVRTQGPQTFTLAQRVRLTSLQDWDGKLVDSDAQLEIHQKPVMTSEGVFAWIGVAWKSYKIDTKIRLATDQIVVLGATGVKPADGGEKATLYYVVRVAPRPDGQRP
ncbi:MAG TPA: hypothetical protein VIF62_37380 [Labilithrix sp.]|jgi:hypothetical protein